MIVSKRSMVIGCFLMLPVLFYTGLGIYALWQTNLLWWSWIFLPVCWVLAWMVGKLWPEKNQMDGDSIPNAEHWTNRDQQAAEVVGQHQVQVGQLTADQLTDPHFYIDDIKSLAMKLALHYHPGSTDPYSSLKVPEVMAAIRLAVEDLEDVVMTSIPGSQVLTIGQWTSLQKAPKWIKQAQDSVWFTSILLNPANLVRYYTSKWTVDPLAQQIQSDILVTLYLRFMRQVGFYLIEMNSGRLRGGADRYRQHFGKMDRRGIANGATGKGASEKDLDGRYSRDREDGGEGNAQGNVFPDSPHRNSQSIEFKDVSIALVGQVSSGKSSLINALMGQQVAVSDVLPSTREVQRYTLKLSDDHRVGGGNLGDARIDLLDTPGYGESGASDSQVRQIHEALAMADAVLLVLDSHTPAKKADQATLQRLLAIYDANPSLKMPPMIAVVTHVDLLSPVLQWNPPYNWKHPVQPKEQAIFQVVQYTEEVFGGKQYHQALRAVAPVCSDADPKRQWGILENVMPALSSVLPGAQAAAILRAYERDLDKVKWWKLLEQVKQSGLVLGKIWLESRSKAKDL